MTDELSSLIEKLLEAQWQAALQYTLAVDTEVNDYAGGDELVRELWKGFDERVEDRSKARRDLTEAIERTVNASG